MKNSEWNKLRGPCPRCESAISGALLADKNDVGDFELRGTEFWVCGACCAFFALAPVPPHGLRSIDVNTIDVATFRALLAMRVAHQDAELTFNLLKKMMSGEPVELSLLATTLLGARAKAAAGL